MREAAVTRVSADLSFFFLLFCLFSPTAPQLWLLSSFLAVSTLFGFLALRAKTAFFRFLAALPPLALILFAAGAGNAAAILIAWLYYALLHTLDRAGIAYWIYRKAFLVMVIPALFACLMVSAALLFTVRAPAGVYAFAAAFFLLGLYTLRALRMGSSTDAGWKLYSVLELLLPMVLAGALGALLFRFFQFADRFLEYLILPLALLIRLLTALLGAIFHRTDVDTQDQLITDAVPPDFVDAPGAAPAVMSDGEATFSTWLNQQTVPWKSILIVLIGVIALTVLVLYLLKSRKAVDSFSGTLREQRFQVFRRRKAKALPSENAERIRWIYQEYLSLLQGRGREIRQSETSEEITPDGSAWELQLRALYLTARYGDAGSLSAGDVETAQDCLSHIRESA